MSDIIQFMPFFIGLLGIGAFAGVLAGLLGVGGGIVLVPAYFYMFQALGYGGSEVMQVCLATSLATIIVTSARSVSSHDKKGAVDWDILRTWAPGIMLGALIGVWVASGMRSAMLQAIFGGLGLMIGLYMAFGRSEWRLSDQMPRPYVSPVIGFLSVLMGIGGGSFGVPLMTLHNIAIHRAVATAAGFGAIIALPAAIGFLFVDINVASRPPMTLGAINLPAFFITIAMTLLTAPLGAKLAHWMDPKPLKRAFAFFLLVVAGNMLRKAMF